MPYDEWRKKVGYARCWKSKYTISNFNQIISETVSVITDSWIFFEIFLKTISFNFYRDLRAQIFEETANGVVVKGD